MREFCIARVVRLFPLFAAGTLLASSLTFGRIMSATADIGSLGKWVSSSVTAIFFLPTPREWSLHAEAHSP